MSEKSKEQLIAENIAMRLALYEHYEECQFCEGSGSDEPCKPCRNYKTMMVMRAIPNTDAVVNILTVAEDLTAIINKLRSEKISDNFMVMMAQGKAITSFQDKLVDAVNKWKNQ